jgi:uncharacterized repeat protein (TIGR03847 family)
VTSLDYANPDRFVAGTVGEPGQRTFYLQVRQEDRITSVVCEKTQVALLAERLAVMLDAVRSGGRDEVPQEAPPELKDNGPLDLPLEEEFRVAELSLVWDDTAGLVLIEARADAESDEGLLQVRLRPGPAREFIRRSLALVSAGRPPCPFCQQPLDPEGHICPRRNGYRRR